MPWVPNIPANTIDQSSTQLSLPYDATSLMEPYTLGPALQGSIPGPPSAPGAIPDMLLPAAQGATSSAIEVQVPSGGVLPDGGAPTSRTGRQSTQNFGYQFTNTSYVTDFGLQPAQDPNSAQTPQKSNVGPAVTTYPGQYGSTQNFTPYLPNSFYVSVGTGAHALQQATNQPARQIIAPY
jgi:hypothetical protein